MVKQVSRLKERGIGKLTFIIFAALIGSALYSAFQIFPFYYYYWELENQFGAAIRVASEYNDQEIREKLVYHMKNLQIPAKPDALKIMRSGNRMKISLKYKEIFYVTWQGKDYDIHTFNFNAEAEGDF